MLEIGVELAGTLNLAEVLETALEKAETLCRAETSSIWEVDRITSELFFRVVRGRVAGRIRGRRVPLGQGIVGSVAESLCGEIVNDVANDPRWQGDLAGSFETRAILAVPLQAHGRVVGVLQLLNPTAKLAFEDADLERMRLFAAPLGQAIENARLYASLEGRFRDTVSALAEAIAKRDPYTAGHVRRVVSYSVLIGAEMDLDRASLDRLRMAATLHDVGKVAVPDRVLGKNGPLDVDEMRLMQCHPVDGAHIIGHIEELRDVIAGVRSHHERIDGRGYPDGLSGAEIPRDAKIIAVADTYDAMTTTRPYRSALSHGEAIAEIHRGSGSQFCPEVVAAFDRLTERQAFSLDEGEALLTVLSGEQEQG